VVDVVGAAFVFNFFVAGFVVGVVVVVDVVVVASVVLAMVEEACVEDVDAIVEEAWVEDDDTAAGVVVSAACSRADSSAAESSNHSGEVLSCGVVACTIMSVAEHATIPVSRRNRTSMLGAAFRRMPFTLPSLPRGDFFRR
jgi:hypothetical protein